MVYLEREAPGRIKCTCPTPHQWTGGADFMSKKKGSGENPILNI